MQTIYQRCGICSHWYSPKVRNHCDVCGAIKMKVGKKQITVDLTHETKPGIVLFSGIPKVYRPASNLFAKE